MSEPKPFPALEALRAAWARAGELLTALPRPARILVATTLIGALLIGAWLTLKPLTEPYGVLFAQLEDQDAATIVAKLKEMKIPYRVSAERGSIEVPESRVLELRMELAGAGLVRGGGLGFEGFDKMRLGATEFEQRVMYRRAMEGELARTIASVASIQSARVHLVLPEKSVFAARREPASASVVVRLKGLRQLGPGEITGIVQLVAAAVPGLAPEAVVLVTTEGQTLHRARSAGSIDAAGAAGVAGATGEDVSQARLLETALEERARTMLERLVGPGHADVRVSAELDLARVERVEDRYDPARLALRSEDQTIERTPSEEDSAAGVPGAESNLPGGAAPVADMAAAPRGNVTREVHTRNYEIDHVSEKRVSPQGAIRRLTVAVVVDGVAVEGGAIAPREREELDKLQALVSNAVGFDPQRQDVITVESIPFLSTDLVEPVETPVETPRIPEWARKYWPFAAGGLGLVLFLAMVLAIRRRRGRNAELALAQASAAELKAAGTMLGLNGAGAPLELGMGAAATGTPPKLGAAPPQSFREEALRRAMEDPATAALVLRHWLGTAVDERSPGAMS